MHRLEAFILLAANLLYHLSSRTLGDKLTSSSVGGVNNISPKPAVGEIQGVSRKGADQFPGNSSTNCPPTPHDVSCIYKFVYGKSSLLSVSVDETAAMPYHVMASQDAACESRQSAICVCI